MNPPTATGSAPADPSHLLWRDTSIFQARYEKSASGLIAIRDALERRRGVCHGVDDFLADSRRLCGLEPDDFTAVWKDPYAYFWMRLCFEVLGSVLRKQPLPAMARDYAAACDSSEPVAVLEELLRDFKRLALGGCLRSGGACSFAPALEVALPMAIPGTRLSLLGSGSASILGCTSSHLLVTHASKRLELPLSPDAPRGGHASWLDECPIVDCGGHASWLDECPIVDCGGHASWLDECPVVDCGGREIQLQPHVHNLPGLELYLRESDEGFALQRRHAAWIESGLALLQRHDPETFSQFRDMIRTLSLQLRDSQNYSNVSHSDLPGTILVGVVPNAHYLADIFVHEFYHHRLFFIEEIEPILDEQPDDLASESHYLSPWREDLRPLHGILHGLYVYIATTRFWLRVLAAGEIDEDTQSLALHKTIGGLGMLRVGAHQLRRHARFTAFGEKLFTQLEADIHGLDREIRAAGLPDDAPFVLCHPEDGRIEICRHAGSGELVGSREQLIHHVRQFAPPDQAEDIVRHAFSTGALTA